ncbi:MAG: response regulator [Desulfobacteraceae bacterium]|nr:response regulator [Desulfobacteraceae bacterium]
MSETNLNTSQTTSKDNPTGLINGFTVSSFTQILEFEQKTCTLRVHSNGRHGNIYIHKGVVLDATVGDLEGEEAALLILGWEDAQIKLDNTCSRKKKVIRSSLTRLILEATRRIDESGAASNASDNLKQAIYFTEGHYFKKAHKLLSVYLQNNPKSSEAWFWYSRCLGNLKTISMALMKSNQSEPQYCMASEELRRLAESYKHVTDTKVRRCPFCWSALNLRVQQCHYCNACLTIASALKQSNLDKIKSKIIIESVTRYTNVVARGNNIKAVYYLSLASCNLKKVEEALDLLNEASRTNPDNKFLSDQLNIIVNHVAVRLNKYEGASCAQTKKKLNKKSANIPDKKKILVVEDSPTTRKVVVLTLKQKGYALVEAEDGLEALSKIDEERPDLILLDIILPKMDGYKILSFIKESSDFKDTPVIMLTSKDGILDKFKGKISGSAAYLTKPFEPKDLIKTVSKYIS